MLVLEDLDHAMPHVSDATGAGAGGGEPQHQQDIGKEQEG